MKGKVYRKPVYFFNRIEKQHLISFQEFLKSPESFINEYYEPIITKDTLTYVYEGGKPAYHLSQNCPKLNSNYTNFSIPIAIREKGKQKVEEYRKWFKANQYLLDKPDDVFEMRVERMFGKISFDKEKIDNSGIVEFENLNLNELESKIDYYLSEAGRYFKTSSDEKKEIISKFQKHTYLAYSEKEFQNNTRFSDEAIRNFLKKYDKNFKLPTKELLKEYYRVKYNPQLKFEGDLLEQLGFKLCNVCSKNNFEDNFDSFLNIIDELK